MLDDLGACFKVKPGDYIADLREISLHGQKNTYFSLYREKLSPL